MDEEGYVRAPSNFKQYSDKHVQQKKEKDRKKKMNERKKKRETNNQNFPNTHLSDMFGFVRAPSKLQQYSDKSKTVDFFLQERETRDRQKPTYENF